MTHRGIFRVLKHPGLAMGTYREIFLKASHQGLPTWCPRPRAPGRPHVSRPRACSDNGMIVISRANKSQWSQNVSAFFKAHETSTHQISRSWGNPKQIGQKKSKLITSKHLWLGQTFLVALFFSLYRYFIETTATDIDIVLQL